MSEKKHYLNKKIKKKKKKKWDHYYKDLSLRVIEENSYKKKYSPEKQGAHKIGF